MVPKPATSQCQLVTITPALIPVPQATAQILTVPDNSTMTYAGTGLFDTGDDVFPPLDDWHMRSPPPEDLQGSKHVTRRAAKRQDRFHEAFSIPKHSSME